VRCGHQLQHCGTRSRQDPAQRKSFVCMPAALPLCLCVPCFALPAAIMAVSPQCGARRCAQDHAVSGCAVAITVLNTTPTPCAGHAPQAQPPSLPSAAPLLIGTCREFQDSSRCSSSRFNYYRRIPPLQLLTLHLCMPLACPPCH
jgi:hypothetical protein